MFPEELTLSNLRLQVFILVNFLEVKKTVQLKNISIVMQFLKGILPMESVQALGKFFLPELQFSKEIMNIIVNMVKVSY